jgi:uncharacterized heparinase superfamily protein
MMTRLTLGERWRLARLRLGRARALSRARLSRLPLAGHRVVKPLANELRFVPSELRPSDPSVFSELSQGQLGLAGQVYAFGTGSPFSLSGTDETWSKELHSFGWLGGLRTAGEKGAAQLSRQLLIDWWQVIGRRPAMSGPAFDPEVAARRLIAWMVNASLLLDGASADFHRVYVRALGSTMRELDLRSGLAAPGYPRLLCALALTEACLAVSGHDRHRHRVEGELIGELERQVLADGGHISRNPEVTVDLLLELLPLRQCYVVRGLDVPPGIVNGINLMMQAMKNACATARELARFNGVGVARADAMANVLALDVQGRAPTTGLGPSRYARLQQGAATAIVDCGGPPPLEHASSAHAGCLSFELAHRGQAIIVNRGAPGRRYASLSPDARATASHSTVTVADQSSAQLVRSRGLEAITGAPAIIGPKRVEAAIEEKAGEVQLVTRHDGYQSRFGLVHERRLTLSGNGTVLSGVDRLGPPGGTLRLPRDLPFAIHFHIALDAEPIGDAGGIRINLPDGAAWFLTASGCNISIEAATDFAHVLGPVQARQIVLRAACPGEAEIAWRLELQTREGDDRSPTA